MRHVLLPGSPVTSHPLRLAALLAFAAALAAAPAGAQHYLRSQPIGGNPGPAHNYVCPNAEGKPALECFYDAVRHLYTMCRHVKSIEIIEFGYEQAQQGANGSKSAYCVDKQKQNMARLYQAALKEATISTQAVDMVRGLHEYWVDSLVKLRWTDGESDDDYKARTNRVYETIDERVAGIRTIVSTVRERVAPLKAPAKGRAAAAPKSAP
jgi:hypothetical protein